MYSLPKSETHLIFVIYTSVTNKLYGVLISSVNRTLSFVELH